MRIRRGLPGRLCRLVPYPFKAVQHMHFFEASFSGTPVPLCGDASFLAKPESVPLRPQASHPSPAAPRSQKHSLARHIAAASVCRSRMPVPAVAMFVRIAISSCSLRTAGSYAWRADATKQKIARMRPPALFIGDAAQGRMEQFAAAAGSGKPAMQRAGSRRPLCVHRTQLTGDSQ